jgi:PAS domain-containing protein
VAVFDAEDRFVFWNRRYAQFYGLTSSSLRPGMSFARFLRHGAERGQFVEAVGRVEAWVAARLRPVHDGGAHREHLPGDRWVKVREHALEDGVRLRTVTDTTGVQRTETSFRLLLTPIRWRCRWSTPRP